MTVGGNGDSAESATGGRTVEGLPLRYDISAKERGVGSNGGKRGMACVCVYVSVCVSASDGDLGSAGRSAEKCGFTRKC